MRFIGSVLIIIIIGIIIFFSMNNNALEYESTLPEEPKSNLIDFFRDKLFYDQYLISNNHDDGYIYEEGMIIEPQRHITYSFSPTNKMYDYYFDRLNHEEEDKYAYKQVNPNSYLEEISSPTAYRLPYVALKDERLTIKTADSKSSWSTIQSNDMHIDVSQITSIRVMGVKDDVFYLSVNADVMGAKQNFLLFMTQDLTDYYLMKETEEAFDHFLQTDEFSLYSHLFPSIDEAGTYLKFYRNDHVIDAKNKSLIAIDDNDYLSDDGKYVYIDGNNGMIPQEGLAEGEQYIKTLENYVDGNDSYELTFDLNFKAVLKASDIGGIGTKVSENKRHVVYFKDELIVIYVSYDAAFFGIAGDTNVVIDFQEDKANPDIYILDLSAS